MMECLLSKVVLVSFPKLKDSVRESQSLVLVVLLDLVMNGGKGV